MNRLNRRYILSILATLLIAGCNSITQYLPLPNQSQPSSETLVMVTFRVRLPEILPAGETVFLAEMDEVTGLAFNPVLHPMEAEDGLNFIVLLPIKINSLLKYRYIRKGDYTVLEHTPDGRPVLYRLYHATEPGVVQDIVNRWTDTSTVQARGRIIGKAFRADNNQPISNLTITAGGLHTLTLNDGSFVLEGLPEGTHHLVAFAQDGAYQIFQQGAAVVNGAATEANLQIQPARLVNVTFTLQAPENTPTGATIRIAGNLTQLGNSFASLRGGTSSNAIRLPGLQRLANGNYRLSVSLPVGGDIRYKYTLGDGVWNSEHDEAGEFFVRQFIVPDSDSQINDRVVRWSDSNQRIIMFDVTVPESTPQDEIVAIQFNPGFAWMEPLPMWLIEPNRWVFRLYSPLRGLENLHYRYCRDLQCGSADDLSTAGNLATGRQIQLDNQPQLVEDQVQAWMWLDGEPGSAVVPNVEIAPREGDFVAGVAFQDFYHPSWFIRLPKTTKDVQEINANWVILQPAWTYGFSDIPFQEAKPGNDIYGSDLTGFLTYINSQGLKTALFPVSHYPKSSDTWWQEAPRDFSWWVSWFTYYQSFIRHHAMLAYNTGASALVLGDPSVYPALPAGVVAGGAPSNVPEDAETRWRVLIQEARAHFSGAIWWAVAYPQGVPGTEDQIRIPAFLDAVDGVYIIWNAALAEETGASFEAMSQKAAEQLDKLLLPVAQSTNKPIILAIQYPSALGAGTGCLPGLEGGCLDLALLDQPNPDLQNISRDLMEQENAYNAMFSAVKDRAWIKGVVSHGYYFPVPLLDKSTSTHGKPSRGVLWFWFGKFLGKFGN